MHWTRGQTLGTGAFGFVSIAKTNIESGDNHRFPPLMAVKSAKLSESKSLSKEKELLDEFKGCPSILRCFGDDVTTENGQQLYNIFLEYALGGSLGDRIGKERLPEQIVSRYTKSLLVALNHIHNLGYVHCDVKPNNVLLVKQTGGFVDDPSEEKYIRGPAVEYAKLADFGSCKRRAAIDEQEQKCAFRGTVLYAAPESITHQEFVPASDVWALGCTVLQMLTGKSPWLFGKRVEVKDVLFKIGCSDEIPAIPRGKKLSIEAKDFRRKCLVKDPSARWKTDKLLYHPFSKIADRKDENSRRRHLSRHLSSKRWFYQKIP